jgi:hypothetical protein
LRATKSWQWFAQLGSANMLKSGNFQTASKMSCECEAIRAGKEFDAIL